MEYFEEECDEIDEYLNSLSDEEYEIELKWLDAIASAVQQGKNVVPNRARNYDFRM